MVVTAQLHIRWKTLAFTTNRKYINKTALLLSVHLIYIYFKITFLQINLQL